MINSRMTKEEVARRGQALYDHQISPNMRAEDKGKFLVLDVNTGDYEIADEDITASLRMLAKNPDAVLYGVRIGFPTAYRLGFRLLGEP